MNREMRRMQEREERLQKKGDTGRDKVNRRASAMTRAPAAERKPLWARIREYLHEVRQELRKVTWPTREQMIAFTAVTVITSVVLTAVVFGLDVAMKEFVFWLVERF
jgi:preprotein translocase subunit SecE